MTIGESIKQGISTAFKNIVFKERTKEYISKTLNTKVEGSVNISIMPPMPIIKVEKMDELRDKVTICYDDTNIEGVITWRPSVTHPNAFVFVKYE